MYSMILMAALTSGQGSASLGFCGYVPSAQHHYGACYGACYGVGYTGWDGGSPGDHSVGGWGLPYGGYGWPGPHGHGPIGVPGGHWPGYACWGGCGGYASPAYGVPMTPLVMPAPHVPSYSGSDRSRDRDGRDRDRDRDEDNRKMDRKDYDREKDKDLPPDKDDDKETEKDKGKDKDKGKEKDKGKGKDKDKGKDKGKPDDTDGDAGKLRARVNFVLPEGAKLHIDDQLVDTQSGSPTFRTPQLSQGRRYFYDVRVEVVRDGKPVSSTRRIVLQAGSVIRADFSDLGPATGLATVKER
jgi:uncharacterized protein (TIGR03000 family)